MRTMSVATSSHVPQTATAELPSPVVVESASASGDAIIVCDHASCAIPDAYDSLGLGVDDRQRHIAWDIGALDLSRRLAWRLDASLVHTTLSRLLFDVNRAPDAHDAIVERSEDTPIPANLALDDAEREQRRRWIHEPYHDAIDALIRARIAAGRPPSLISIHSFTPVYRGHERPWHIGVLSHRDRRLADLLLSALREDTSLVVGDNQPYAPRDGVYHTLQYHAETRGLPCVMLEIRNDLITDRPGHEAWAERLAPLLSRALAAITGPAAPPT